MPICQWENAHIISILVHWHIIARYRDDSHFPESIWGIKQRDNNPETLLERAQLAEVMQAHLCQELQQAKL